MSSYESQVFKVLQLGGFLSKLFGPLAKTGLSLIKNITNH